MAEKLANERALLIASFAGLAFWAWRCPCDVIFKCHRDQVLASIAALFFWIFSRTAK
jgi:hypothetical protein